MNQFWYRTKIGKFDLKLGRTVLNEDFNRAPRDFISGYFCLGQNVRIANNAWPTNPVSEWAVRVQYPVMRDVIVKTAVYQYNLRNLAEENFYFGFDGANGVTVPAEIS